MNLVKKMSVIESELTEIKELIKSQNYSTSKKEIMTAQEVLELLSINRSTFTKWRNIGFIKVYSLNRRLYCKRSEIMQALENGMLESN